MTVDEIKSLALWAKAQQIQSMSVGDVSFVFSPLAMVPQDPPLDTPPINPPRPYVDEIPRDDPDLYYSVT